MYYRYEMTNFTLDTELPIDTGLSLNVTLIKPRAKIPESGCVWYGNEKIIHESQINLVMFNY